MRVLCAMNAFKGCLSAKKATSLVASGFRKGYPEALVIERPLADGGDGTLDVLLDSIGGSCEFFKVQGPYGESVYAPLARLADGRTFVIESAKVSGLSLAKGLKRDVKKAESTGVGQLMIKAVENGARRIIIGIGGTAMNDGGIGAVQAAGGLILNHDGAQVEKGLLGLSRVDKVSLGSIPQTFKDVEIIGISDVENPLLGLDGATRVYGPQKGLQGDAIEETEANMAKYAQITRRDLGRDPAKVPMAGAGGGLGAALWAFFGAQLKKGSEFILRETGTLNLIHDCDLVITGEGRVDSQTQKGKVPFAVASLAQDYGVPTVVIGGGVSEDLLDKVPMEFSLMFSSTIAPMTVKEACDKADRTLPFVAEQIGRAARIFSMSFPCGKEVSAGGVVVRRTPMGREILMIQDRFKVISLPKGHVDPGETPEETAIREVFEETGLKAFISPHMPPRTQRYRFFNGDGKVVEKLVYYYLMEPLSGESEKIKAQPGEVLNVFWVPEKNLPNIKSYPGVLSLIKKLLP